MLQASPHSDICSYLSNYRSLYPDISSWYAKVNAELGTGRRSVLWVSQGDALCGVSILKLSEHHSKLCHFSVASEYRRTGVAGVLWGASLAVLRSAKATEVHVTTSESVFRRSGQFFASLGFRAVDHELGRYRGNESEVFWTMDPREHAITPAHFPTSQEWPDSTSRTTNGSLMLRLCS